MLTDNQREIVRLHEVEGHSLRQIARDSGRASSAVSMAYARAKKKLAKAAAIDPGALQVLDRMGLGDLGAMHSGWVKKTDTETGESVSVYYHLGQDGAADETDLESLMESAIEKVFTGDIAKSVRPKPTGDHLLVIDIADLHIGKLALKSETGHHYDREEAVRRGIEGCRALLEKAQNFGVQRILFVLGNDIIHIDTPTRTTTSGTPQDTDGSLSVMWDDAFAFYVACIDMCREYAPVSLLHCPSNHDWFSGFTLARAVRAWYRDCPEVHCSEYNTSMRHRKYFVFEGNLLGFTHGDGAKEADLVGLMLDEVPQHLGTARRRYWYLHHLHHKIAKKGRGTQKRQTEKDLVGVTVIRDCGVNYRK